MAYDGTKNERRNKNRETRPPVVRDSLGFTGGNKGVKDRSPRNTGK